MFTIWPTQKVAQATICFLVVTAFSTLGSSMLRADDRTIDEFKTYVAERTNGQLSDAQVNEIAKLVDKNGDGTISDDEFSDRMGAFRKVVSGGPVSPKQRKEKSAKKLESQLKPQPEPISATPPRVIPELTSGTNATVLLITADELVNAWIPFANWKTANGKLTKVVTVEQIAQQYTAENVQEKIRLCVREHIDNHKTRWVVIGGDCLPGGTGLVPGGHSTVHAQERAGIPTDIVYLSKTNWDADSDGIYGEFDDDRSAISYPDGSVGLGRIPVRTKEDVTAFTEKVIAYESKYPATGFAKQMIYTCTDQPAYPKVRNSWDGYLSKVWNGEMERFFSTETPWDEVGNPGSHQLSAENLVELINKKSVGKFHIHGHGHLPAWVLERSKFTGQHINQLENADAYPLITTVSCNTGEYDSKIDPSIVEQIIRRPNGGSVAVVAPVRTGKPHFAKRSDFRLMVTEGKLDGTTLTMTRYWSSGLGQGVTTGEAIMQAKSQMAEDAKKTAAYHLCICELNLLGDPTLDMRSDIPRSPKLTVANQVAIGKQDLEIKTDAPGSTICVWKGKEIYNVIVADASGKAVLSIAPKTAGEVNVSVSGPNLNTQTTKVAVVVDVDNLNLSRR